MTIVSASIPRFIAGVSQQPDKLKRADQLRECINGYPSPAEGLIKRQPTNYIGKLLSTDIGSAKCHFIKKDNGEQYVVIITPTDLRIFDLEGNPKTITFPDGKDYLNVNSSRYDLSTLSVADYLFILNKTKSTAMTDDVKVDPYINSALVYVKTGNVSSDYKIFINGTEKATYTTSSTLEKTNAIALDLYNDLKANLTPTNNWNIVRKGSVILIQNLVNTDFQIRVEDSDGNNSLLVCKSTVGKISDLPDTAPNGFMLKVVGEKESRDDDYYVEFQTLDQTSNTIFDKGNWIECAAVGVKTTIDSTTMPHALIRKADGTFSFESIPYTDRQAGDDNSNEIPSFIGNTINEIFTYKNRMGILSGESITLSSIKDIYSYFKESTLTELDTDPIDVTATTGKRGTLRHAIPYSKELLLFSSLSQYVLEGSGVLTAKTVSINLTTEFENSIKVTPVNAGNNVFFAFERSNYTGLRQFYTNTSQVDDAEDITSWLPTYIPKNVFKIANSTLESVLCLLSEDTPNKVYLYKYLFQNGENQQASWVTWQLSDDASIVDADFLDNVLYLVIQYPDGVYLEKIDITIGLFDINYTTAAYTVVKCLTRLDRKVSNVDSIYDADNNETLFTLPYNTEASVDLIDKSTGLPLTIKSTEVVNGCLVCIVDGNHTSKTIIGGINYPHSFELPTLYYRQADRLNDKVTVIDGDLQLLDLYLNYANTGYFEVDVTPLYQDTITEIFTGMILDTPTTEFNILPLSDGEFSIPILCKNTEVSIVVRNNTYKPSTFLDAVWQADFSKVIGA